MATACVARSDDTHRPILSPYATSMPCQRVPSDAIHTICLAKQPGNLGRRQAVDTTLSPHLGMRNTEGITAFPVGITTGATWNKELMYLRGVAIGEEFRGRGANIHLGPSVGALGRKPRGGRNWECFGSDPVAS